MDNLDILRDLYAFYVRITEDEKTILWRDFQECLEKHHKDPDVVRMARKLKDEETNTDDYREFFNYVLNKEIKCQKK